MRVPFSFGQSRFNEKKATQAAARFLNFRGGRMNYMKLIKLLYMLDREALLSWGRPVTFDTYFSMRLGPVLSEVHDLITDPQDPDLGPSFWGIHISDPSHYSVALVDDPGSDELSEAEMQLIEEVWAKYGHFAPFDLVEHLHQILPEWKDVQSGRVPIEYADILKAGGKPSDEISAVEEDLRHLERVRRMFAAPVASTPLVSR
jgi:uncharacterized phage-associated protein